jgi:hypothetical protein
MNIIQCQANKDLQRKIRQFAEELKVEAHKVGTHGLSENDFYNSGLFRGAIERIRGQYAATMREKREFVKHVLNYMQDQGFISEWEAAGEANRHDYSVKLPNGRVAVIELKGCLDGNNTNIFVRPPHAQEFIIWSVCTNAAADHGHNAWSGIHTRLSAEIITGGQRVDGVVIWDMVCGTIGRPCPKVASGSGRITSVGPFKLVPPCIYLFPATIPSPRNNPRPAAQTLGDVGILKAFGDCFKAEAEEIHSVEFEVEHRGSETVRTTRVCRNGTLLHASEPTPIMRS